MSKVQLVWQVDDGYAGPSRPQSVEIYMDDFCEDDSDEEIGWRLDDAVDDAFRTSISAYAKNKEEVIAAIRRHQEENKDNDDE